MAKSSAIFSEIYIELIENIMPSIVSDLKEMGMQYAHVIIEPAHSMCFFNYLRVPFPFDVNDLSTFTDEKGKNVRIVILNLRFDGELSISDRITIGENGLATLRNNFIIFDDFNKIRGVRMENAFLFHISKEFTAKAEQFQKDIEILRTLLGAMRKIRPKITREVLVEKYKKSK
jgi:hypothetical protein